jgi:hypothetical protein
LFSSNQNSDKASKTHFISTLKKEVWQAGLLHLVICPKCGQAFDIENIEKHVITCKGKEPLAPAAESQKAQESISGASA